LLIPLDDPFRAQRRVTWVLPCGASRPSLPQEIPALVECDLDGAEPGQLFLRETFAGMGPLELVLFCRQLTDPIHDLDVIHLASSYNGAQHA
jgi:hypothetical protein